MQAVLRPESASFGFLNVSAYRFSSFAAGLYNTSGRDARHDRACAASRLAVWRDTGGRVGALV